MMADLLKPTDWEIRALAVRETDPRHVAEFEPIVQGPVIALLILAAIGLAAVPMTLFRLLTGKKSNEV